MEKQVYSSLCSFLQTSENVSWNRFYHFLVANSILILSWTMLYVSDKYSVTMLIILVAISGIGFISCICWAGQGYRGRKFLYEYLKLGKDFENSKLFRSNEDAGKDLDKFKLFTKSKDILDKLNDDPRAFWVSSHVILVKGPLLLACLYVLLIVASAIRGTKAPCQ